MTFYGPSFPNESHYENLTNARQRFGSRSANMFFVRPARHAACPRRLKFMHNIKTGFIPYIEDTPNYASRLMKSNRFQNSNDLDMDKTNGFGLYNSADAWRHELMDLAQQIKSSLTTGDEQEQYLRQSRSARLNNSITKRSCSSASGFGFDTNDEQNVSKRLLQRRASQRSQRPQTSKVKPGTGKADQEQASLNDENQDPGIWLIPILCYILQTDNIFEAQDWLVNANPTEKRLAMELISRTMHDMQCVETDLPSDTLNSDQSSSTNMNNVYWPYKIWQRQEKDRQKQQLETFMKQSKLTPQCSVNADNNDTCERATSPLRTMTPGKRLTTPANNSRHTPVEITVVDRPATRHANDRATPTIIIRDSPNVPPTDRPYSSEKRPLSRLTTASTSNAQDRSSRRGYRVATSLNNSYTENTKPITPTFRGKTPLI
ncbi:unnamed protein product [Adineta ricciae]|uniref:Protein TBATA n=1 Tax=Adineta ricciae TaxID=249248 RepID=A0A813X0B8_ADIRI|nr:unnamed protein product [Adineta ricciae]CAF1283185.1 unnamed protein product [Adineta ricciae]